MKKLINHIKLNLRYCIICIIVIIGLIFSMFFSSINTLIEQYVSFTGMGIFAGLILAMLFPVLTTVYESVGDDEFNRKIIGIKVFNILGLFKGLLLIGVPFVFWKVNHLRVLLFSLFILGCLYFFRIILRAHRWNDDWDEAQENGIRKKWRGDILDDSRLSSSKRLILWQSYLSQVPEDNNYTGKSWLSHFNSLYTDNRIDKGKLTNLTLSFWNRNRNKLEHHFESDFTTMAIQYFISDSEAKDNNSAANEWLNFLRKESSYLSDQNYSLGNHSQALIKQIRNYSNHPDVDLLIEMFFNLLFEHSRESGFLLNAMPEEWTISSQSLADESVEGFIQRRLLYHFFVKTTTVLMHQDDQQNQLLSNLNELSFTLFKGVHSISLGLFFEILSLIYSNPEINNELVLDRLKSRRVFGITQLGDNYFKPISESELEEEIRNDQIKRNNESFKIIELYIKFWKPFDNIMSQVRTLKDILNNINLDGVENEKDRHYILLIRDGWVKILETVVGNETVPM